ncbi:MAG: hypothetical protein WCK21_02780 [Actinomycetota bacterium]
MKVRAALAAVSAGVLVAAGAHAETVNAPAVASAYAVRLNPPRSPMIGNCRLFPADNPWNLDVRTAPVRAGSAQTIAYIQAHGADNLHPDFGENPTYGLPYVVVPQSQPLVPITYTDYGDESDPGPFPIPLDAPVEAGGDAHVLVVRQGTCDLFELYGAHRTTNGWAAASGARFDLTSNALRPLGWTSADAAGLPITPGLVRYEEVASGHIDHAIRVTFGTTQRGYILPATHFASSTTNVDAPPMGLRLRLRAEYDTSGLTGQALVIAQAMKTYGLIVADNGSNWFFQGAPGPGWNDGELNELKAVPGTAFEVVDTGPTHSG